MSLTWLPLNPLARCAGETRRASAALSDYAGMGAGRSLRGLWAIYERRIHDEGTAADVPTRQLRTIMRWSSIYQWQARIDEYDRQQQEAVRQATEAAEIAARIQEAQDLAEKRKKALEDQLEDARIMRAKARAIVSTLPLVREIGKDKDGLIVEIAPASSAEYRAAQAMMDSAAKLEAARLGLPTEVQQVDVKSGGEKLPASTNVIIVRETIKPDVGQ